MDLGLTGKVFVVTAASGGLGRATADQLVAEGARVVLVARRPEPLQEAVAALGPGSAVALAADLNDLSTAEQACALALETWGRLDGALISVGGPAKGEVLTTADDVYRAAFDSVVVAALRAARDVVAAASGPVALAFVLSTSAKEPLAGMAPSNVTRPGLGMLIRELADEFGASGSRVVGVMPGTVQTDRINWLAAQTPDPDAAIAGMGAAAPMGRVGQPSEFGKVAAFLLSDAASYVTGCLVRSMAADCADCERHAAPPPHRAVPAPIGPGRMTLAAATGLLACPTCRDPLTLSESGASCRAGHRFDTARQGYLNLLGGPQPANADTPAMVSARERVLARGAFDPLDAALARRAGSPRTVVDIGGGTGHHLARLLQAHPAARGVSLDVSVAAAKRAARAQERAASVVADAWGALPLRSGRFDLVTCVFAPRNFAEFARVLGDGGLLLVVTPDPEHLASVRERYGLLGIDAAKDDRLLRAASGWFEPVARHRVTAPLEADASLTRDLIAMGPNAFHGLPEEVEATATELALSVWTLRRPRPVG